MPRPTPPGAVAPQASFVPRFVSRVVKGRRFRVVSNGPSGPKITFPLIGPMPAPRLIRITRPESSNGVAGRRSSVSSAVDVALPVQPLSSTVTPTDEATTPTVATTENDSGAQSIFDEPVEQKPIVDHSEFFEHKHPVDRNHDLQEDRNAAAVVDDHLWASTTDAPADEEFTHPNECDPSSSDSPEVVHSVPQDANDNGELQYEIAWLKERNARLVAKVAELENQLSGANVAKDNRDPAHRRPIVLENMSPATFDRNLRDLNKSCQRLFGKTLKEFIPYVVHENCASQGLTANTNLGYGDSRDFDNNDIAGTCSRSMQAQATPVVVDNQQLFSSDGYGIYTRGEPREVFQHGTGSRAESAPNFVAGTSARLHDNGNFYTTPTMSFPLIKNEPLSPNLSYCR